MIATIRTTGGRFAFSFDRSYRNGVSWTARNKEGSTGKSDGGGAGEYDYPGPCNPIVASVSCSESVNQHRHHEPVYILGGPAQPSPAIAQCLNGG